MNPSPHPLGEKLRLTIVYLFYGLIFITPLVWTSTTSELFEFPKMLLVYAFTVLIFVVWLMRIIIEGKLIFRKTFMDWPLLLFLISQAISTILSIDRHTSLWGYYSRFNGGLVSIICYLILYWAAVSHFTLKNARTLLFVFIAVGIAASLYAFPEHYGHSPSCLKVTGQFDAKCWVQDVQTRVFGTFGQPNWLSAFLISLFFIPLALIIQNKKYTSLISNALITTLFFSVILFTKSRSGYLGLAVGFVIFWVLNLLATKSRTLVLKSFSLLSIFLLILFFIFGRGALSQTDKLFNLFNKPSPASAPVVAAPPPPPAGSQLEVGGTESTVIRNIVWSGAISLWQRYPLFGSGVETFAYGYYNVRPVAHNLVSEWDFLYNKAHNEFLNYLSTTGLFGLLTYLSIIIVYTFWSINKILQGWQSDPPAGEARHSQSIILLALLSGFWALQVSNFYGFSTVPVQLIFYLFPALALLLTLTDQPVKTEASTPLTTTHLIILGAVSLASLFMLLKVFNFYQADLAYAEGKRLGDADDLTNALPSIELAVRKLPDEPVYLDELSLDLARAAAALASTGQATQAAQFASQAEIASDQTLALNRVHLNFYKTRARVFVALSVLDPRYIPLASDTLLAAIKLAPTDAKLWYNLALMDDQLGQKADALKLYEQTVALKPNYESARQSLAELYQASNQPAKALEQYQYILKRINPNNSQAQQFIATNSAKIIK